MMYDWARVKDDCYQLYVVERLSLEEVVETVQRKHAFEASRRAFQVQFSRWKFPPKYSPAHKNAQLVERVRQLWQQNYNQAQQLQMLQAEGYDINSAQLRRVRTKEGLLLRESNTLNPATEHADGHDEDGVHDSDEDDGDHGEAPTKTAESRVPEDWKVLTEQNLTSEERAWREQRRRELEAESQQQYATKKRRRRIKGWASLPPDPPAPPRFPSETTIAECVAILQLDNATYLNMREQFTRICNEQGIVKKTMAGPEAWQAAKHALVQGSVHLRSILWDETDGPAKHLAIEQICLDVTKRIRHELSKMTLVEARRVLGVNPEEGRELRFALVRLLAEDKFVGKLEAGKDHWDQLKARWVSENPTMQRALAAGLADPDHASKTRAVDVVARDAMRRWVDRSGKKAEQKAASLVRREEKLAQRKTAQEQKAMAKKEQQALAEQQKVMRAQEEAALAAAAAASPAVMGADVLQDPSTNTPPVKKRRGRPRKYPLYPKGLPPPFGQQVQVENAVHTQARLVPFENPEPAAAAVGHAVIHHDTAVVDQDIMGHGDAAMTPPQQPATNLPVYFRLHPTSTVAAPLTWIALVPTGPAGPLLADVKTTAVSDKSGAVCLAVQGVLKDGNGGEMPMPVRDDLELGAYLLHVQSTGGGAPIFEVHLVWAR